MSAANDVLTEILARVSTQLGSTFSEHTRAFDIESLSNRELENGYSATFDDATEDTALELNRLVLTRTLTINITYRTFATNTDNKTKTVQATALTNEENIIKDLRDFALTTVSGSVQTLETSSLRVFFTNEDTFLLNEIKFKTFYRIV